LKPSDISFSETHAQTSEYAVVQQHRKRYEYYYLARGGFQVTGGLSKPDPATHNALNKTPGITAKCDARYKRVSA